MARQTSSYQSENLSGDKTRFVVRRAEIRLWFFRPLIVSCLPLILAGIDFSWFIISLILAVGIFIAIRKSTIYLDKKKRGMGGSFVVSKSGIELSDGTLIPQDRIHRLIIRNTYSNHEIPYSGGGVILGGTGAIGVGMAVAAGMSNAMGNITDELSRADLKRKTESGYRLDVEYGGTAKTLAGGMTETTSFGLMKDVANILGLHS